MTQNPPGVENRLQSAQSQLANLEEELRTAVEEYDTFWRDSGPEAMRSALGRMQFSLRRLKHEVLEICALLGSEASSSSQNGSYETDEVRKQRRPWQFIPIVTKHA